MDTKPLDVLATWDATTRAPAAALREAAERYATEYLRAKHLVAHHLRNASALAQTYGHDELLAQLPQDVASALVVMRDTLLAMWSQLSSDPVPSFEPPADEPVPPEPTPGE